MEKILIPQPIPREICLGCDVCCRFPERDSFLSPFFTAEEMEGDAVCRNTLAQFRPDPPSSGGQVVPVPMNNGFRCPFFNPETDFCDIYDERPLDCRLYPYALMLDPTSSGVWLGIDTKCRATDARDVMEDLVTHATHLWKASTSSFLTETVLRGPRLVGPYQPDVLPLFRLEELSEALLVSNRLTSWSFPSDAAVGSFHNQGVGLSGPPIRSTHPLTLGDRLAVESYLRLTKPRLAAHSFAIQFMASDLTSLVWSNVGGFLCLWAFDKGTVYMPLPPLGVGDFRSILPQCFAFMDQHNLSPEISRIENLSLSDIPKERLTECHIRPGYPDYVYQRADLRELRGRAFHGKRSDCRAFSRRPATEYRPYSILDKSAALNLFDRWQTQRMKKTHDPVASKLLEDSRSYHLQALTGGEAMGLIGRVITVEGEIVGYTFGTPLNDDTFVVALEVADPAIRGAATYIFREFCRELEAYTYINAMDDSGLPGLRRLKRSYHPCRLEPSFVLYRQRIRH